MKRFLAFCFKGIAKFLHYAYANRNALYNVCMRSNAQMSVAVMNKERENVSDSKKYENYWS